MLGAIDTTPVPTWFITLFPLLVVGTVMMFFWNSIISLAVYKMTKADRGVDALKTEIKDLTTKLVDERFRAVTHEINNEVNAFKLTLTNLSTTVAKAEQQFDDLWDGDHAIENKMIEKMHAMQLDSVRELGKFIEKFATKADVDRAVDRAIERSRHS